jgi:hypothetical protein
VIHAREEIEMARPETGIMQFGEDRPGVFIRGDDAYAYAVSVELASEHAPTLVSAAILREQRSAAQRRRATEKARETGVAFVRRVCYGETMKPFLITCSTLDCGMRTMSGIALDLPPSWTWRENREGLMPLCPACSIKEVFDISPRQQTHTRTPNPECYVCSTDPNHPGACPSQKPVDDPVNRPAHYTSGKIEVIDFIDDQKLGFALGNCVKYIARAGKKDPSKIVEDLEKSRWYLDHYIKQLKERA